MRRVQECACTTSSRVYKYQRLRILDSGNQLGHRPEWGSKRSWKNYRQWQARQHNGRGPRYLTLRPE